MLYMLGLRGRPTKTTPSFRIVPQTPSLELTDYFDHPLAIDCRAADGSVLSLAFDKTEAARLLLLLESDERFKRWARTVAFSDASKALDE